MSKHYKKSIVYPETAREWLQRYEGGEALKTIAQREHFDIRTVKRQVAEAISDRNIKEVRQTVLRSALERHFNDFVTLAEKMRGMVAAGTPISLDPDATLLLDGLKQHLPRSPLWDYLAKYEGKLVMVVEFKDSEQENVENVSLLSDIELKKWHERKESELIYKNPADVVALQVQSELQKAVISDADNYVALNPPPNSDKEVSQHLVIELLGHKDWTEQDIQQLQHSRELSKHDVEMKRLQQHLNDELTTIILRRVVPGRCRYCPI